MSEPLTGEQVGVLTQSYLKRFLEADDLFNNITVIDEDVGDIQSQMNKALATYDSKDGARGVCVLVQLPSAGDQDPGILFPGNMLRFTFLVLENRFFNKDTTKGGTGKRSLTVARRINRILKAHRAGGLIMTFMPDGDPNIIPRAVNFDYNATVIPLIGYEVRFRGKEADNTIYTKVSNPAISGTSTSTATGSIVGTVPDTVTLTCSTSGAEIFYSTNLTLPGRSATGALFDGTTLYEVPFSLTEDCTLMVRAQKAGSVGSDTIAARFD